MIIKTLAPDDDDDDEETPPELPEKPDIQTYCQNFSILMPCSDLCDLLAH